MLQHRLKKLKTKWKNLDFSILAEYDGRGCCESMLIVADDSSTPLDLWAQSVGWFSRPIIKYGKDAILYEKKTSSS